MFRNGLEPWHILVTVAVVILLFGSKKLPDMARGLGKSMRILKAETAAMREDIAAGAQSDPATPADTRPAVTSAPATTAQGHAEDTRRPAA